MRAALLSLFIFDLPFSSSTLAALMLARILVPCWLCRLTFALSFWSLVAYRPERKKHPFLDFHFRARPTPQHFNVAGRMFRTVPACRKNTPFRNRRARWRSNIEIWGRGGADHCTFIFKKGCFFRSGREGLCVIFVHLGVSSLLTFIH